MHAVTSLSLRLVGWWVFIRTTLKSQKKEPAHRRRRIDHRDPNFRKVLNLALLALFFFGTKLTVLLVLTGFAGQ